MADSINAFNIGALALITLEDLAAHADDLKLVLIAICVQVARQGLRDEVDLLHLRR